MKAARTGLLLLSTIGTVAVLDSAVQSVDRARLIRDVAALADLSLEGRATGSTGGIRARQLIAARFADIGLERIDAAGYEQPFTAPGNLNAANVVGRIAGRDPRRNVIVVTAHYDHLGVRGGVVYPGADDNASGVAVLLAVAHHLRREPPRHPFVLAALDAEERGFLGARALLASSAAPRDAVALNINLDMVSRSTAREIYAAGSAYSPWQIPILRDVQRRATVTLLIGHDRPRAGADGVEDWTHASDHAPFHDAGIPFVYFGVEAHPDYHQPTDTVERIDRVFLGNVADMVVDAVATFDARLP